MPSLDDRKLVTDAFYNACIWPHGDPELDDAWLGVYQMLLWYEHGYIHIREANDLRKSRVWQERARLAEAEVAAALHLPPDELSAHVDRMMSLPRWQGMQRNNPLGNGLRILVGEILRRWGDDRFLYEEEVPAQDWFPGIQMPGRSEAPKIDVVALKDDRPRTILSCKWSGRHDRMSDVTNECQEYKAAAVRRQNMTLQHFVITNEIDGQRSDKILNQPCVDGLILIRLPLAEQLIGGLTPLMTAARGARRLLDLTELLPRYPYLVMPDWLTPEQRSRNMSAIRSSGTSPERRLRKILKSLFPRRLLRERPDLPGRPDFFFPGLKLAVFADGCFWHGCPLHGHIPEDNRDYWEPKIARTRSRDKKAGRDLARLGVHSLRVWEHELSPTTVDQVVARIQRASRRAAHPRRVILAASRFAEPADGRKLAGPQI